MPNNTFDPTQLSLTQLQNLYPNLSPGNATGVPADPSTQDASMMGDFRLRAAYLAMLQGSANNTGSPNSAQPSQMSNEQSYLRNQNMARAQHTADMIDTAASVVGNGPSYLRVPTPLTPQPVVPSQYGGDGPDSVQHSYVQPQVPGVEPPVRPPITPSQEGGWRGLVDSFESELRDFGDLGRMTINGISNKYGSPQYNAGLDSIAGHLAGSATGKNTVNTALSDITGQQELMLRAAQHTADVLGIPPNMSAPYNQPGAHSQMIPGSSRSDTYGSLASNALAGTVAQVPGAEAIANNYFSPGKAFGLTYDKKDAAAAGAIAPMNVWDNAIDPFYTNPLGAQTNLISLLAMTHSGAEGIADRDAAARLDAQNNEHMLDAHASNFVKEGVKLPADATHIAPGSRPLPPLPVTIKAANMAELVPALQKTLGITPEHARYLAGLYDAQAKSWVPEGATKPDPAQWYATKQYANWKSGASLDGDSPDGAGSKEVPNGASKTYFQSRFKGSVTFYDSGLTVIRGLTNPNASTAIHELGHVIIDELVKSQHPQDVVDVETLQNHYGSFKNGVPSDRQHEMMATDFENYVRYAKAPTENLKSAFGRLKSALTQIYGKWRGVTNPEIRPVFDRALGQPGSSPTIVPNNVTLADRAFYSSPPGTIQPRNAAELAPILQDIFNATPQHAKALAQLYDARARAWADHTGRPVTEWYESMRFGKGDFSRPARGTAGQVPTLPLPIARHYTSEDGLNGIIQSQRLLPSVKAFNPNDARYGDGQYVTGLVPGSKSRASLSSHFLRTPYHGNRFSHFVEIDTKGLNVQHGRRNVYVIPNNAPLSLKDRILNSGRVLDLK